MVTMRCAVQQTSNSAQRLMVLRIIWAAMLIGLAMFLAIVLTIGKNQPPPDPTVAQTLLYVAVIMLAALVPIAFVIRAAIYRNNRTDAGVEPGAYATDNLI